MILFLIFILPSILHLFHLFFLLSPRPINFSWLSLPLSQFHSSFLSSIFFSIICFFFFTRHSFFYFHPSFLSLSIFSFLFFLSFLFHGLSLHLSFFMLNLHWFLPLSFHFSSFPSFPFQSFLHYFTNVGLVQTSTNVSRYAKNLWLESWKHENNRQWLILRYHHFF